jgi:polysaccharide export outer membrane protein
MRFLLAIIFLCGMVVQSVAFYRLQPGDKLSVSVWQDDKLNREVVVGPHGGISLPLAGHIRAGGLTTQQIEAAIRRRLQSNYKEKLDVTVMLIARPSPDQRERGPTLHLFVTGEVNSPGTFTVTLPTTVLQALTLAGGLDVYAAKRRIVIQRKQHGEDVIFPFNYRAAVNGRDAWSNNYLRDGDVVIVPERGLLKGLF